MQKMETTTNKTQYLRHTAIKTTINEILLGDYVHEEENNSNYLLTKHNKKIFRLNIMAVVVSKEILGTITNLSIDDGTGKIILRSFEEIKTVDDLNIGETILIIGRSRIYNQEKYISPEIIKTVDPLWLKVRSLELKNLIERTEKIVEERITEINLENQIKPKNQIVREMATSEQVKAIEITANLNEEVEDVLLPIQKLSKLIFELDQGQGVLIEEIIEKSPLEKTEELIEKMLKNGDIFQNSPGKVKIL